jgi:uncharacterized protein (TIGR02284 family)
MLQTKWNNKRNSKYVRGLISILEDGKLGYTNAAEHVENDSMKTTFFWLCERTFSFIVEIQDEINRLGKSTDESGGGLLSVHTVLWIDIKSTFTGGDTEAIINACITGEGSWNRKYKMVIEKNDLQSNQIAILSKQLSSIESTLKKLKHIRLLSPHCFLFGKPFNYELGGFTFNLF